MSQQFFFNLVSVKQGDLYCWKEFLGVRGGLLCYNWNGLRYLKKHQLVSRMWKDPFSRSFTWVQFYLLVNSYLALFFISSWLGFRSRAYLIRFIEMWLLWTFYNQIFCFDLEFVLHILDFTSHSRKRKEVLR